MWAEVLYIKHIDEKLLLVNWYDLETYLLLVAIFLFEFYNLVSKKKNLKAPENSKKVRFHVPDIAKNNQLWTLKTPKRPLVISWP